MNKIQNSKFKIQNYNSKVKIFALLTLTFTFLLLTFYFAFPTSATVTSARDWIGIYAWDAADNNMPIDWFYLNCGKTADSNAYPAGSCNYTYPSIPGMYQFRMFANDSLYDQVLTQNFWVNFTPTLTQNCISGQQPVVYISWPALAGVNPGTRPATDKYQVFRNNVNLTPSGISTNNYNDTGSLSFSTTYTYFVKAFNQADPNTGLTSVSAPVTTPDSNCIYAWIQTSGGDVHSNNNINSPGGP